MFHFPALPPHRLYIHRRVTRHHSCRVSPFGHPRIHARLTAPRGISQPPTSFIGSRCQGIHHVPLNTYKHKNQETKIAKQTRPQPCLLDARNHYPQNKHHTPPPRWSDNTPTPTKEGNKRACCLRTQQCARTKPATRSTKPLAVDDQSCCCLQNYLHHQQPTTGAGETYPNHHIPQAWGRGKMVLLRKEVIQPHLPVRLPCYDFVPIADPTFDGSLHKG